MLSSVTMMLIFAIAVFVTGKWDWCSFGFIAACVAYFFGLVDGVAIENEWAKKLNRPLKTP